MLPVESFGCVYSVIVNELQPTFISVHTSWNGHNILLISNGVEPYVEPVMQKC